jgi:tetratricopeptide (TPR) repeat protein
VKRSLLIVALWTSALLAQAPKSRQPPPEPPEEDEIQAPKEYTFNPLQAQKDVQIGNYYFKKGSFKAAARRFEEASRWNPSFAEAYLRWGETEEKLHDPEAARKAYEKYLQAAPEAKNAAAIRKKIDQKLTSKR